MTNGINTKTDVELLIAKEAETRGLKLSDYSCTGVRGNHAVLKDLDNITNLTSRKTTSEDHNLNELDKSDGMKNKVGRSAGKTLMRVNGRVHSNHNKNDDDEDDTDSDSLSMSSNSLNNSRKSSRSNSPKVSRLG